MNCMKNLNRIFSDRGFPQTKRVALFWQYGDAYFASYTISARHLGSICMQMISLSLHLDGIIGF